MSNAIGALLSQKPSSAIPEVGQTRNFSIEERPKKSGEGTWKKAKNEGEGFGLTYKVLKVDPLDDYTNEHGTLNQFSLMLELAEGNAQTAVGGSGSAPNATNVGSGGDARDESIARAVAFKGAVELIAAGKAPEDSVRLLTDALLPIVKGTPVPPPLPPPMDTAESVQADQTLDADIPF